MYYAREIGVLWRCTLFGPYGAGIWPPPPWAPTPLSICLGWCGLGLPAAFKKDGPGKWSGDSQPAQHRSFDPGWCTLILSLFHLENCLWSVYQMIICLVLIAVIFLGWLTTRRNKQISYVHSSHFPGLGREQYLLLLAGPSLGHLFSLVGILKRVHSNIKGTVSRGFSLPFF